MSQVSQKIPHVESRQTILPILVLYNCALENSATYRTFLAASKNAALDPALIAVYDNSPVRQVREDEESHLLAYKHDPSNGALAAAYNWALAMAVARGFSWLLLLDQDSCLPSTFMALLAKAAQFYGLDQSVAAIVPFAMDGHAMISPKRVCFGLLTPLPKPAPIVAEFEVMAINSGAAIKVSFLRILGGFNPAYRLDCLDHWLFRQIYAQGKRVALSCSVLEHDLSASDYRNQVSLTRYRSILSAEVLFITTQKFRLEIPVYVLRLMLRALKQLAIYRRPKLAALTFAMVVAIIARRTRIS